MACEVDDELMFAQDDRGAAETKAYYDKLARDYRQLMENFLV